MVKKAVILCGGLATRFMPICKSTPKEMLPILDKPLLQYLIEELSAAGISEILIILGRNKESIIRHFDKFPELEERLKQTGKTDLLDKVTSINELANISYIMQINPKGTGYATLKAKEWVGADKFYLIFGDEIMFNDKISCVKQILKAYSTVNQNLIAVQKVKLEVISKYSSIDFSKDKNNLLKVKTIVEKPKPENAPSNFSYFGPCVLDGKIFPILEKLPQHNHETYLTDAMDILAKQNKLYAVEIEGKRFDVGSVGGLIKANLFYALQDKALKNEIKEYAYSLFNNKS